jgi:molecular chaperone DnaK
MAVGIDLGTSNSCVAIARKGRVDVLPNAYGERICPSVVHFAPDGSVEVGSAAKAHAIQDPESTVTAAKRLMGRYYFSEEVKKARAVATYAIVEGPNHSVRVEVHDQVLAIPEVSAYVLREMKAVAEANLGRPVTQAVITVPAYFNDNQRQATRDAGRIAGLEVLRLLNEPTAAALAYGFGKGLAQRVAVYDLGGGTFDISILEIGSDIFEVLSTCGDTFLGGEDFDDRLIDLLADAFLSRHGINLRHDRRSLEKLKAAAEAAKKELSLGDEARILIRDVARDGSDASLHVDHRIDRREFAALVSDLVQRTFKVCDEALQQANLTVRDLDGVILVGGPTRLPVIREAVAQYFQREPMTDVDPDEVVAMGAAIHAAALVGAERDSRLLDVTPLSLRIGVAGGLAETVIERNTPVPIEQTSVFTTFRDYQQSVRIRVYQGEARAAEENELLGEFEFSGFKNARRGEVRIEVTFEIDTDGIVNVTARDPETGKAASTQIHLSSGLSEQEIAELVAKHRDDSCQRRPAPARPQASAALPAAAQGAEVDLGLEGEDGTPASAGATRHVLGSIGHRVTLNAPLREREFDLSSDDEGASGAASTRGGDPEAIVTLPLGRDLASEPAADELDPLDLDEADLEALVELTEEPPGGPGGASELAATRPHFLEAIPASGDTDGRELFEAAGADLSGLGEDGDPPVER